MSDDGRSLVGVKKKFRNLLYVQAREILESVSDGFGVEAPVVDGVVRCFVNWMDHYNFGRFVRLSKGDEFVFISMVFSLVWIVKGVCGLRSRLNLIIRIE